MKVKVTRDDAIRLNYECTLILMALEENQLWQEFTQLYKLEKTDLPCFRNRIATIQKFDIAQDNVFRAINDVTLDSKIYTIKKLNSGELMKDLEIIKSEVDASIKLLITELESGARS